MEKVLLKKLKRKKKPQVIIINEINGIGKSIEQLKKDGLKVIFNKFKKRRSNE
jgi:hypothetical protein